MIWLSLPNCAKKFTVKEHKENPSCSFVPFVVKNSSMQSLLFTAPYQVAVQEQPTPNPDPGEVLVQTLVSAISPGTEMLIYRGQFPNDLAVDESIGALAGAFGYPLRYGYAAVGRVISLGEGVEASWLGRLVFAFQPHGTHFAAPLTELLLIPEGIAPEAAAFLPNMETAVNFVLDGAPLLGERVTVFGQGVVGLLTTALLAQFPLASLTTVERFAARRQRSLELGAHASLDPAEPIPCDCDLTYELSGAPQALDAAIAATGFDGRVIIGSWYGQKRVSLDLGGRFHRSRIRLISSQVSTLAPGLAGRWTKARRFEAAWQQIERIRPERLITHRIPFERVAEAYQLLDQQPQQTLQILLTYSSDTLTQTSRKNP
jgi:2-desacetyl-2-hydroxyethyl bacteriochlorophyllide A dehydrogenase